MISKDHPRSRGVYTVWNAERTSRRGSSPLARGLLLRRRNSKHALRIIPARAGFTAYGVGHKLSLKDHPRSRGVYRRRSSLIFEIAGSSPLARGLLPVMEDGAVRLGIIPARAGFTSGTSPGPRQPGDHPRSRGVYSLYQAAKRGESGSSPLARGLHEQDPGPAGGGRIIPARAGFT